MLIAKELIAVDGYKSFKKSKKETEPKNKALNK